MQGFAGGLFGAFSGCLIFRFLLFGKSADVECLKFSLCYRLDFKQTLSFCGKRSVDKPLDQIVMPFKPFLAFELDLCRSLVKPEHQPRELPGSTSG